MWQINNKDQKEKSRFAIEQQKTVESSLILKELFSTEENYENQKQIYQNKLNEKSFQDYLINAILMVFSTEDIDKQSAILVLDFLRISYKKLGPEFFAKINKDFALYIREILQKNNNSNENSREDFFIYLLESIWVWGHLFNGPLRDLYENLVGSNSQFPLDNLKYFDNNFIDINKEFVYLDSKFIEEKNHFLHFLRNQIEKINYSKLDYYLENLGKFFMLFSRIAKFDNFSSKYQKKLADNLTHLKCFSDIYKKLVMEEISFNKFVNKVEELSMKGKITFASVFNKSGNEELQKKTEKSMYKSGINLSLQQKKQSEVIQKNIALKKKINEAKIKRKELLTELESLKEKANQYEINY